MITAAIIKDSINEYGNRLTTFSLRYPKFIHGEFMTHRVFCLAGDTELEFDLPSGSSNSDRRVHRMQLGDFVRKWYTGVKPHKAPRFIEQPLDLIDTNNIYTAKEIATLIGEVSASNIRTACRKGVLQAVNTDKLRQDDYRIRGSDYIEYRSSMGIRTYAIQTRLSTMRIRQLNEITGMIQTSRVKNCFIRGEGDVYTISTVNGVTVTGTLNHRVLTNAGWLSISKLIVGKHQLCVRRFGKLDEDLTDSIRLKKIDGAWRSSWQIKVRPVLLQRQDSICTICALPLEEQTAVIHHIIPVYKDVSLAFDIENVSLIHFNCHKKQHEQQGWQGGTYLYGDFQPLESIKYRGREMTYDLEIDGEFANFIGNGVVVHNSRNASSSRAIPTKRYLQEANSDHLRAAPIYWGMNKSGMQADSELDGVDRDLAKIWWGVAARKMVKYAEELSKLGVHKQIVNRILEPFLHINVVVTATEYMNFFGLRLDRGAQPEMQYLANQMYTAYKASTPKLLKIGQWHLPYIDDNEIPNELAIKVSVARCARVSYKSFETDKLSTIEEDLALYDKLLGSQPIHASPAEHQAKSDIQLENKEWKYPELHGNFVGWCQYRKMLLNEAIAPLP